MALDVERTVELRLSTERLMTPVEGTSELPPEVLSKLWSLSAALEP